VGRSAPPGLLPSVVAMSADDVLMHIVLERMALVGAVFVAIVVLVILVGWLLRTGRR
jgi:cytochrome c oxidase subunit IV